MRTKLRVLLIAFAALALTLGLTACGGDDDGGGLSGGGSV